MKISFNGKYKSLTDFVSDDLTGFCIITGKNGVGKTQLIEAIKEKLGKAASTNQYNYSISISPHPNKPQFEGVDVANVNHVSGQMWEQKISSQANTFIALNIGVKEFIETLIKNGLTYETLNSGVFELKDYIKKTENYAQCIESAAQQWSISTNHIPNKAAEERERHIVNNLKTKLFSARKTIFISEHVATYGNKRLSDLILNDYYTAPLFNETLLEEALLFNIQIENLFYNYARKRLQNEFEDFRHIRNSEQNNSVSDAEFIKQNPPPWDRINQIFEDHKIGYSVVGIGKREFTFQFTYHFYLIKTITQEKIEFRDLSSGEKIIIGLILKLFLTNYYLDKLELPDYIFLDEPDAHLHPEMSKLLIEVLNETFVENLGIKVLITTHDPSTIALAPENCIYEMNNGSSTSLRRIAKDDALKMLTGNIPILSIDYNNHRQVFVESKTDIGYFQKLFTRLNEVEKLKYKLYFISSASGTSNCAWVKDIVPKLRIAGVHRTSGIIDWDLRNISNEEVYVHGENQRYSIENYVYDPLYLCIHFLDDNLEGIRRELGFNESYNPYKIVEESEEVLQIFCDWLVAKVANKIQTSNADLKKTTYYNSKKVNVPSWYLQMNGHDLEIKLKIAFPSLSGAKFKNEGELQSHFSTIMARCFPLVPKESVELLKLLCG